MKHTPLRARLLACTFVAALATACGGANAPAPAPLAQQPMSDAAPSFPGNRAGYSISRGPGGFTVTDKTTGASTAIGNATNVRFADVTLNLGIAERSRTVPQADLDLLIELYIAFFNRVPDADGLSYWIGQYQSGVPLVQICESFYTAAVQYSDLTGYSATMSNADFVRVIYRNVLGRTGATAPPDADVQFWAGELASGRATKGSLVRTMLASAHSFQGNATWGWVTSLLDNKITVGRQFAVVQGLNFNSASESITRAMAIAAAVTPTDTAAALARIGITDAAYADNSKPVTLGLMRAAHMYSNYGDNVRGFKPSLTDVRQAATATSVSVGLSRSSFQDASGATLVFDTAVIRATGVRLAGGASHAAVQFTASRRADNGEMAYDFRPSSETSLAGISGFGGDVRLAVSADGRTVNQWELVKVRGAARELIAALVLGAPELLAGAQATGTGGLDKAALVQMVTTMRDAILVEDQAYFNYLRAHNIDWLALTIPIFYGDLSDPRVYVKYRPLGNIDSGASFTFDDDDLAHFLAKARRAGFKIMVGLELSPVHMNVSTSDPTCNQPNYKPNRWLLGQPTVAPGDPMQACMNPAHWWWNPAHADHARNTGIFWQTYTEVAVKYARMLQQAGVEMYAIATEQDNLFRTRAAAAPYTNHFKPQLQTLVSAVRASYSGLLTYDQQHQTMTDPGQFAGGGGTAEAFDHVFEDLGLEVVGTSAYFKLTASPPGRVLPVAELEAIWDDIFRKYLIPRQAANPGKPLVFTEFGYTDSVSATALQGAQLGELEPPAAGGVSPGQQQQQNIFQAYFNVNARHGNLIRGSFLWGVSYISPYDCDRIVFGIYCKASAETIKQIYGGLK